MKKQMSLSARREFIKSVKEKYLIADWNEKSKIIDGIVAATDYKRKYVIQLLNSKAIIYQNKVRQRPPIYNDQVRQALAFIWQTANKICSKRLVPFLPDLIFAMENHGHLHLPDDIKNKILKISPATVDRLLRPEKENIKLGLSTTKKGTLLKHQIQIRTFADWDDVIPGFVEADLVAHCGGNTNGAFLNTLTLIDISTSWLECIPLIKKSASEVISGLNVAEDLFPFTIKGVDTDCGSEFINYDLLNYCEEKQITFTRARTHKKNDQAHVEEKNGSVVRRLVGYDRFEGRKAWIALAKLYKALRKYINFFQPSLKLIAKERQDGKVSKKYDVAKTPYQRVMKSKYVSQNKKDLLKKEYESLDPVKLLKQVENCQDELWKFAWNKNGKLNIATDEQEATIAVNETKARFYHVKHNVDFRKSGRTWRTREDSFKKVWHEIQLRLELIPETTAKQIIEWLITKYDDEFSLKQVRTLQRRIAEWQLEQESQEKVLRTLMFEKDLS